MAFYTAFMQFENTVNLQIFIQMLHVSSHDTPFQLRTFLLSTFVLRSIIPPNDFGGFSLTLFRISKWLMQPLNPLAQRFPVSSPTPSLMGAPPRYKLSDLLFLNVFPCVYRLVSRISPSLPLCSVQEMTCSSTSTLLPFPPFLIIVTLQSRCKEFNSWINSYYKQGTSANN